MPRGNDRELLVTEDTSPENFLGKLPNLDLRKLLPISVVLTRFVLLKKIQIHLSSSKALGNIGDVRAKETLVDLMHEGPVSWGCAFKSDASHATHEVAEALKKLGMTEEELEEEFGYKY